MGSELAFESGLFAVQLALTLALFVLIAKLVAIAISNGFHSPYLATPHIYLPKIADALDIRAHDVVYDLGSGDGRLMLFGALRHPEAKFVGIERNPLLVLYARLQALRQGNPPNVSFVQKDFFETNLDNATRVYAYLLPVTLNKLFLDTKKGTRLVSRAYTLHGRTPLKTIELSSVTGTHGEHLLHVYEI